MIHERFDLAYWERVFSLYDVHKLWIMREGGRIRDGLLKQKHSDRATFEQRWEETLDREILSSGPSPGQRYARTGPFQIAMIEQMRRRRLSRPPYPRDMQPVPVDLFLFRPGHLEQRDVTKFGGLPYWPAERPWPATADGTPMTFIAQFNFGDSHDIIGNLPGDLLLLFGVRDWWEDDDSNHGSSITCEWISLGNEPLVTNKDIPRTDWEIPPCYGVIHRTVEYDVQSELTAFQATKIGGIPHIIQTDPRGHMKGRFLATLGRNSSEWLFPLLRDPLDQRTAVHEGRIQEWWDKAALTWADNGLVYLFLADAGAIRLTIDSH